MIEPESPIEIDFSAEKTEAGWIAAADKFWLAFTPKLFEWLGWVALLAGVRFIHTKSPSIWLGTIIAMANVVLVFYFIAYFHRFRFVGLSFAESPKARLLVSLLISCALSIAANQAAYYAAAALANGQTL